MTRLVGGLNLQCDDAVLEFSPEPQCYDMASGTQGEFFADGEINVIDYRLHRRMLRGGVIDRDRQYMRSTAQWNVRNVSDCSTRRRSREPAASIWRSWSVTCTAPEVRCADLSMMSTALCRCRWVIVMWHHGD